MAHSVTEIPINIIYCQLSTSASSRSQVHIDHLFPLYKVFKRIAITFHATPDNTNTRCNNMQTCNLWTYWMHVLRTCVFLHALQITWGQRRLTPGLSDSENTWFLTYPRVTVAIARPIGQQHGHVISVPLQPDMTVLTSLIQAAMKYKELNRDSSKNPYNLGLEWDKSLGCYIVAEASYLENRARRKWMITVLSGRFEILYQDRCVPNEDDVILRPFNQVLLSFKRVKKLPLVS